MLDIKSQSLKFNEFPVAGSFDGFLNIQIILVLVVQISVRPVALKKTSLKRLKLSQRCNDSADHASLAIFSCS